MHDTEQFWTDVRYILLLSWKQKLPTTNRQHKNLHLAVCLQWPLHPKDEDSEIVSQCTMQSNYTTSKIQEASL